MNIYIRLSIEYKMPMSEVRRCLTIKFTLFLMLVGVALAQKPDTNTIVGPMYANGGGAAKFRKYYTTQIMRCVINSPGCFNNIKYYVRYDVISICKNL